MVIMLLWIVVAAISYFLGSIPFSILIAKTKNIDLTKTGSGNPGATNVLRTMGPGYGAAALALDFTKGALAVMIAKYVCAPQFIVIFCACLAVMGHMFSPFLDFKGGKGVATGLGVTFAIAPYLFILCFLLGTSIIFLTGFVSLGSITGSVFLSILMFTTGQPTVYCWGFLLLTVFVVARHVPNIKRLLNGTENKFQWKK